MLRTVSISLLPHMRSEDGKNVRTSVSARDFQIDALSSPACPLAYLPTQLMSESYGTPFPSPTAVDLLWK